MFWRCYFGELLDLEGTVFFPAKELESRLLCFVFFCVGYWVELIISLRRYR